MVSLECCLVSFGMAGQCAYLHLFQMRQFVGFEKKQKTEKKQRPNKFLSLENVEAQNSIRNVLGCRKKNPKPP